MSNFWETSEGVEIKSTGEFESGGGNFQPIPDNTQALAMIEKATWNEYEGEDYINIKWLLLHPEQYKGRIVFQKIKIYEPDPKKSDTAKRMLAAIDANAGSPLAKLRQAPTPIQLIALQEKQMLIKIMVWENNDKSGNWVSSVAPKPVKAAPKPVKAAPKPGVADDFDDEIPW